MEDTRQYNNEGGNIDSGIGETPVSKPKRPWIKLSILLLIFGGLLVLGGFATGSRGGRIYFNRGLQVEGFSAPDRAPLVTSDDSHFRTINPIHTLTINDARFRNVTIVPTDGALEISGAGDISFNITEIDGIVTVSPMGAGGADIIGMRNATYISLMDFGGAFGISYRSYSPMIAVDVAIGNNFTEGDRVRYLQYNIAGRVPSRENIHVYLPSSVQNLNITTSSGTVRVTNEGTLSGLNVTTSSGNIHVNGGTILEGNLRVSSGTTRVNVDNVRQYFSVQSSSGNIHFNANHLENGSFRASSGVIRIDAPVERNISVQTSSGNIHFDSGRVLTGDFRASSGVVRVNASFEERFSVQTGSGNIHFNGARLANGRINSSSGVIRVNAALDGDFSATSTSGNIHVDDTSTARTSGRYTLRATSGNIRFNTSRTVPQFTYTVNVGSGTIRTEGRRREGRTFTGGGVSGTPYVHIDATTTSGNVHLNFGQ